MGVVYGQWAGPYPGPTLTERRSAKTRRAAGPNAGDRKNGWGGGVVCQTVDGSPPPPRATIGTDGSAPRSGGLAQRSLTRVTRRMGREGPML